MNRMKVGSISYNVDIKHFNTRYHNNIIFQTALSILKTPHHSCIHILNVILSTCTQAVYKVINANQITKTQNTKLEIHF